MPDHPFGWFSLLPPISAILLAIATRRVIASLLAGVFIGALVQAAGSRPETVYDALQIPAHAIADTLETHLWGSLANEDHLRVFAFTLLMGAMIGVIHRSGGMHAVVDGLAPLARTRRGGQLMTWVLGLIVFIDDYANTLLLGHTMRPLSDRLKISREKLAYIVDSTAAPVSGLALVSTWVAGEIGYIEAGYRGLDLGGATVDGMGVFIETIPYRFYVLWALWFVPLTALSGRDFGPMLRAEQRTWRKPLNRDAGPTAESRSSVRHLWLCAVAPVAITVVVTVWLLYATGAAKSAAASASQTGWRGFVMIFGSGDSYLALLYGSLAGLLSAMLLARRYGILTFSESQSAAFDGARLVLPALAILWLAWSLSELTGAQHLGTGEFLGGLLKQTVSAAWLPTIVFVLSSLVAFATGTSWGTMGILMPLVVRVTWQVLAENSAHVDPHDPILIASIGGVLAGAIFGDHCSPISDTTVLSSQASGCEHVAHVWTQMPYALLVALVSVFCGTLPVGFGASPWLMLLLGAAMLAVSLFLLGTVVESDPST